MIPAKSLQKDTLQQITAKIRQSSTVNELKRLERSCDRLYLAGLLSLAGFKKADGLILDNLVRIAPNNPAIPYPQQGSTRPAYTGSV